MFLADCKSLPLIAGPKGYMGGLIFLCLPMNRTLEHFGWPDIRYRFNPPIMPRMTSRAIVRPIEELIERTIDFTAASPTL